MLLCTAGTKFQEGGPLCPLATLFLCVWKQASVTSKAPGFKMPHPAFNILRVIMNPSLSLEIFLKTLTHTKPWQLSSSYPGQMVEESVNAKKSVLYLRADFREPHQQVTRQKLLCTI